MCVCACVCVCVCVDVHVHVCLSALCVYVWCGVGIHEYKHNNMYTSLHVTWIVTYYTQQCIILILMNSIYECICSAIQYNVIVVQ